MPRQTLAMSDCLIGLTLIRKGSVMGFRVWNLPAAVLLLAYMTGCSQEESVVEPTPAPRMPGCRVERLGDAIQAVNQLTGSKAIVYKIEGDLATCKFEVFYRPDEEADEELVFSATGDKVAENVKGIAPELGITETHDNYHILAITLPDYPPRPGDEITFSFSVTRRSDDKSFWQTHKDSRKAEELFPDSLLTYDGPTGSGGSGPITQADLEPGQESVIVELHQHWFANVESEEKVGRKRDQVRYRVTVKCLEDESVSTRDLDDETVIAKFSTSRGFDPELGKLEVHAFPPLAKSVSSRDVQRKLTARRRSWISSAWVSRFRPIFRISC